LLLFITIVKSKPGPDGGQVHLLLCVHASVTRQAATGSQEPGTAGRKHSRGAPRDLFSPERRQVSACHSRNTNTNTCVPVPAAGGPWKLTNGRPGSHRVAPDPSDSHRSVPGFLRPVYSVRTHTTARPRQCAATVHAAIAGPKRTQEPSPAGVVRFEGPR
jgi:hypothetical protein